jgi:hypothetical protein
MRRAILAEDDRALQFLAARAEENAVYVRELIAARGWTEEVEQEASQLVTGAVDWCLQTTQQGS